MQNYFENQKIHWDQFSPKNIIFKSNTITKKLLPEENVMSWKTKESRHTAIAKKTGATPHSNTNWNNQSYTWYSRDSYKAVFVQLTNIKQEFVCANIDFVNYMPKKDSLGGIVAGLDALVYINSFHDNFEWKQQASGNYGKVKVNQTSLPDDEGYRIAYGGQGDSNYLTASEFIEIVDISEAVRMFLIERVLKLKRGLLEESKKEEEIIAFA
jgi:hypothetical protein